MESISSVLNSILNTLTPYAHWFILVGLGLILLAKDPLKVIWKEKVEQPDERQD